MKAELAVFGLAIVAVVSIPHRADGQGALPPAGAVVRLTLTDTAVSDLHWDARPQARTIVGRFVGADSAAVTVRTSDDWDRTFPVTSVQRLDVRTSEGYCARSGTTRALCVGGSTALGAALGYAVGTLMKGPAAPDLGFGTQGFQDRSRDQRTGAEIGGLLGVAVGFTLGGDHWRVLEGWRAN